MPPEVLASDHPGLPLSENRPMEPALLPTSKAVSSRLLWDSETRRGMFPLFCPGL